MGFFLLEYDRQSALVIGVVNRQNLCSRVYRVTSPQSVLTSHSGEGEAGGNEERCVEDQQPHRVVLHLQPAIFRRVFCCCTFERKDVF